MVVQLKDKAMNKVDDDHWGGGAWDKSSRVKKKETRTILFRDVRHGSHFGGGGRGEGKKGRGRAGATGWGCGGALRGGGRGEGKNRGEVRAGGGGKQAVGDYRIPIWKDDENDSSPSLIF